MDSIGVTLAERQTLNIEDVAKRLGINRSTAYELARRDQLPVPVIRLGRRMVVSRHALETLLAAQHERGADRSA
jgi:excisionase family DNA binding protein